MHPLPEPMIKLFSRLLHVKGEMEVTPACFAHLLSSLLSLASGKVAVVLEGGYCLDSLAEGAALSLRTLLGDPCPRLKPLEAPCERFVDILLSLIVFLNYHILSIQETIMNCIYTQRVYWRNLCLQDVYNIEELNNINPQSNLHKVSVDSFVGGPPVPERFATRDCYPVQSEVFKREIADKLLHLKFFTNLTVPANRVCYVYDDVMLQHENIHER